ncbi:MAG: glycosyltransferase family 2 protein [Desulfobulbaceae bacterium]|nr:MAG: glycosyltransferase family 2 protein [Desulfobulbaceae bacterium]
MVVLFIICCSLLFYIIFGYPIVIYLRALIRPMVVEKNNDLMVPVSIIICAKDEEQQIADRIENILGLDYPQELVELIIVSDGSNDRTDEIVSSYADKRVRLIALENASGKAVAINTGVQAATNQYLIFGDARQTFEKDVIQKLLAYFHDPSVGAVSGRLVLQPKSSSTAGEGVSSYWNYEVWLRSQESKSGSVIGVTGAIYALKKSMFEKIPAGTILDDVLIPMNAILKGIRIIYEQDAIAYDSKIVTDKNELNRKTRTLYGNLQLLSLKHELFLPWKYPAWWRFVSHKILRLFLPFLLFGLLVSSLLAGGLLTVIGTVQVVFWIGAIFSILSSSSGLLKNSLGGFLLLNISLINAWHKWLSRNNNLWLESSSKIVE